MYDTVGVIVGRFQVPTPTDAHIELITHAINTYDTVIVFVGHSPINNRNNIIPNSIIRSIITKTCRKICYELRRDVAIIVSNIQDVYDYTIWSKMLDNRIDNLIEMNLWDINTKVTLIGGRDSFIEGYCGKFTLKDNFKSELGDIISASAVRLNILNNGPEENEAFLRGMIYERLRAYLTAYQTVDACIMFDKYILLGRRSEHHKWRFIGGFSDPESGSLEEDAIRETFEETGLRVTNAEYVASTKIDDKRYKGTGDCIKTALFTVKASGLNGITLEDPIEKNGFDDMPYIRWFNKFELTEDLFVTEHVKLFKILIDNNLLSWVDLLSQETY